MKRATGAQYTSDYDEGDICGHLFSKLCWFVVAISDLVHDVQTIFNLHEMLNAFGNLF